MNFKSLRNALFAASAFGMMATAAHATPSGSLLFSQPALDGNGNVSSDVSFGFTSADDFGVAATANTTGVVWYGGNIVTDAGANEGPDSFQIMILEGTDLATATTIFSSPVTATVTPTALLDSDGFVINEYEADFVGPLLSLGSSYFLVIANDLGDATGANYWGWSLIPNGGTNFGISSLGGAPSAFTDGDLAFSIYGDVLRAPEPAALGLMGAGLLFLARRRVAK